MQKSKTKEYRREWWHRRKKDDAYVARANARSKIWYQEHKTDPEYAARIKEGTLSWRKNNPKKYLRQLAKARAKERGRDFNLTEEDIVIPEVCPILGTPFQYGTRAAASVDCIDPSKGYTKDNIQIISWKANAMKQDASPEELRKFANWALKTFPP